MGSSRIHHGYASFSLGSDEPEKIGNLSHPFNHQHIFEAYVRTGRWANYFNFGMRLTFRRHSPLRPYVANLRHRGAFIDGSVYRRGWEEAIQWTGSLGNDGTGGGTLTNRLDTNANFYRDFGRTYILNNYPNAIGSMAIEWQGASSIAAAPNPVDFAGSWGRESISEIDLPRNTIGNIFKHPYNRSAWFNETLIVPLSQGQIQVTGAYNPPEEEFHHAGYQVYYTKTGGTGVIEGAIKTTGSTSAGTPARFTDTTYAAFTDVDEGKYIAIHGRGIYLITTFIDASNVDTDAVVINEDFTTESGLTWTLRAGPIGEYYFRRRPYFHLDQWANNVTQAYSATGFTMLDERLCYDKTAANHIPQRLVYDGYSHWWWTTPNRTNKAYGIMRWLHMSSQPFQDVLNDGSMTGLNQATWGATAAAPLGQWEDIIVDQNRKLWISCLAGQDDRYVLARMHPAPGGNAAAPAVEAQWRKQQSAADAGGLTSRDIVAICDDRSGTYSGGPGSHRIWAIGGNLGDAVGGISYSDDDGATWKRLHALSAATGTATATNGNTSVLGSGTTFTTQFAVGDWIRFGADTRSYEIAGITDNLNMTLADTYQGATGGGKSLQKGALAANEAICKTGYDAGSNLSYADGQHNIDWDTNGNVYWISHSGRVCRWKPVDGACVSFAQTAIPAVGPLSSTTAGNAPVVNLKVIRVPNPTGIADHPFHNEVWLGCGSIGDDNSGGWIRVRGDQPWTASPTAVNFTRYHYNNSIVTSFPSIVKVPKDGTSQFFPRNTSIFVEPTTGNIGLFSSYGEGTPGWHWLNMTGASYWQPTQNMCYSPIRAAPAIESWRRIGFDERGMGLGLVVSAQDVSTFSETEHVLAATSTTWVDKRWNGSQWLQAMVAGSVFNDLNMRSGSNALTRSAVLGDGVKRCHEWPEPIEYGMYISFLQAGGAVAQTDEFLADESSTFVCCIGAVKDNTQTANVFYQTFVQPTVQRLCDEAVKLIRNIHTVDYGLDGGYTAVVTDPIRPPFIRGAADAFASGRVGAGQAAGYLNMVANNITDTAGAHAMAALRIPVLVELDNDGSWLGGTDLFNTAGGYVFGAGDIGKSIFIEGANGAAINADNGQAVILAVNSPTQVQVDKVFVTTRTAAAGRRWKLKDVPVVSFVEGGFDLIRPDLIQAYWQHDLWSSADHGVNWSTVKYINDGNNSIPVNGPDDASPGSWFSTHNGVRSRASVGQGFNVSSDYGCSVIFDLRDLPENVRRRQYWRWRMYDPDNLSTSCTFAGIRLYDENFKFLGRPATNKIDDADDDVFGGCQVDKLQNIRASGSGATPVDDGNGDGLTNIVNVAGSLHQDSGVNDAQVTSAGRFIDPGASFTRLIVGNYIRINGAANAANNGWALITGFVSATEVQTSKAFVNETNTFSWARLAFGPLDELRIESQEKSRTRSQTLDDTYWVISDVPSSSQILVTQAEIPHPITAANWDIGRNITVVQTHDSEFSDWDTNNRASCGPTEGTVHFGYDLEFVTVQVSTLSATSAVDDDGDGCTDIVTLAEALTALDGPVAGDFIELVSVGYGRRMFEIVSITGSDPNKVIKLKYDELVPGASYTWTIRRRRDLQQQARRVTVVGQGSPVT